MPAHVRQVGVRLDLDRAIRDRLAVACRDLAGFFGEAAERHECTVSWAE
ncbi:hypothetical protein [Actinoplanes sp. NPDC020271]